MYNYTCMFKTHLNISKQISSIHHQKRRLQQRIKVILQIQVSQGCSAQFRVDGNHESWHMLCIPKPSSQVSNFGPEVCFWWVWGAQVSHPFLEDAGQKRDQTIVKLCAMFIGTNNWYMSHMYMHIATSDIYMFIFRRGRFICMRFILICKTIYDPQNPRMQNPMQKSSSNILKNGESIYNWCYGSIFSEWNPRNREKFSHEVLWHCLVNPGTMERPVGWWLKGWWPRWHQVADISIWGWFTVRHFPCSCDHCSPFLPLVGLVYVSNLP